MNTIANAMFYFFICIVAFTVLTLNDVSRDFLVCTMLIIQFQTMFTLQIIDALEKR